MRTARQYLANRLHADSLSSLLSLARRIE